MRVCGRVHLRVRVFICFVVSLSLYVAFVRPSSGRPFICPSGRLAVRFRPFGCLSFCDFFERYSCINTMNKRHYPVDLHNCLMFVV